MNSDSLQKTKKVLSTLKMSHAIRAFVFDYDGVLYGRNDDNPKYRTHDEARSLLSQIADAGYHIAVITARDASFKRDFMPFLFELSKNNPAVMLYVGGANGSNVDKIQSGTSAVLYENVFSSEQTNDIMNVFRTLGLTVSDIDPVSKKVFEKFLAEDWSGYVDAKLFDLSKEGQGLRWVEKSKITIALPTDRKQQETILDQLRERLKNMPCVVSWAHDAFVHVTPKLQDDGKKLAIQAIQKDLSLRSDQMIIFGDTPHGNDAELLTYPNAFTNYFEWKGKEPPYILPQNGSPVESVHRIVLHFIKGEFL